VYPSQYYSLFPAFSRNDEVFVAISFADEFTRRWENVIVPAVSQIETMNDRTLRAHRVDVRNISDDIITEILTGISHSRLFLADVTTIGRIDNRITVRSGNVLYAIGLPRSSPA
jgi:hypothetical protein